MNDKLTRCIAFLRGFNGAHDDWAEEIERLAQEPPTRIPDPTPCCPFCGQVHGQQPCRTLKT